MTPVQIFNTSVLAITVVVNNGTQGQITSASSSSNWSFNPAAPAPDVFGPGQNSLLVTMTGALMPQTVTVNVPATVQIFSPQLYLFFSPQSVAWALLNNGELLNGGGF
jgi:hypothetical protein